MALSLDSTYSPDDSLRDETTIRSFLAKSKDTERVTGAFSSDSLDFRRFPPFSGTELVEVDVGS